MFRFIWTISALIAISSSAALAQGIGSADVYWRPDLATTRGHICYGATFPRAPFQATAVGELIRLLATQSALRITTFCAMFDRAYYLGVLDSKLPQYRMRGIARKPVAHLLKEAPDFYMNDLICDDDMQVPT